MMRFSAVGLSGAIGTPEVDQICSPLGGPETDPVAYGLFREHPELRDGHLHLGDSPGFGLEVDWAFVDKNRLWA